MFKRFDTKITAQYWDHLKFLRAITLTLAIVILILYLWLFYLIQSTIFDPIFVIGVIAELTRGLLFGGISGLIVGFLILLPKYLKKQWDLHIIVPYFLEVDLSIILLLVITFIFTSYPPFMENGISIGFSIGSFISIIAYAGEVQKEHKFKNDQDELQKE